ncbi:M48 family metallopeptidase [Patescibacteria group bacterium]|nr:M48 family metallopeptidase [Patescibacteria group bacterium]
MQKFATYKIRMSHVLAENQTRIDYTLKRSSRARRLRLTLHPGGELVVTVPMRASLPQVEDVIRQHADWISRQQKRLLAKPIHDLPALSDQAAYRSTKLVTQELVKTVIARLSEQELFPLHTITIKNHRTRWGSCSKRGNLNFNYRIALLPTELAEYIIVHELCHLYELNHSVRFWKHVARLLPDFIHRRQRLREYVWRKT